MKIIYQSDANTKKPPINNRSGTKKDYLIATPFKQQSKVNKIKGLKSNGKTLAPLQTNIALLIQ